MKFHILKPDLVAVIGATGDGIFVNDPESGTIYLSSNGVVKERKRLDELLAEHNERRPVYKGETVEVKF